MAIDWAQFRGRTTFILGADKHAGKTTFLKYALSHLRSDGCTPGYMSTGIDGEGRDNLTGAVKPTVFAERGDVIATTETALAQSEGAFEILQVFDERTLLGRPVVAAVRRAGQIELIGPGSNRRLGEVIEFVHDGTPAEAVLVDGAADRVTQVASAMRASYVMVLKATPATLNRLADRVRLIDMLADLPPSQEGASDSLRVAGALTPGRLAAIPGDCRSLVIDDFTKVFVSYAQMSRLARRCAVSFARRFDMLFFVVNLCDVGPGELACAVGSQAMRRVVINPLMEPAPC
jgi:hypothetical protein